MFTLNRRVQALCLAGITTFYGGLALASAYSQFADRTGWWQDREGQTVNHNPTGTTPAGWAGYDPNNTQGGDVTKPADWVSPGSSDASGNTGGTTGYLADLTLTSTDIASGNFVADVTCNSEGRSPNLAWSGTIPSTIKSFALTMVDTNLTTGANTHWIVYNISASKRALLGGISKNVVFTSGLYQGLNDFGTIGYQPPCPSIGETHTYTFELMALDASITVTPPQSADYTKVMNEVAGHIVGTASLRAKYSGTGGNAAAVFSMTAPWTSGTAIPARFTCDGLSYSPSLTWNVPDPLANPDWAKLQAFALLVTDTSEPIGSNAQWVVYDIPPATRSLAEHQALEPENTLLGQGSNDFENLTTTTANEKLGYAGPCPPAGDGEHLYSFRLLALDTVLSGVGDSSNYSLVNDLVQGHVIGESQVTGKYTRSSAGSSVFRLTSSVFADSANLPVPYRSMHVRVSAVCAPSTTQAGRYVVEECGSAATHLNQSPPLQWENTPAGTKSFALFMKADSVQEGRNTHWVVWNIPGTATFLNENIAQIPYAGGVYQGLNNARFRVKNSPNANVAAPPLGLCTATTTTSYATAAEAQAVIDAKDVNPYNGYWGGCAAGRYVFTLVALDVANLPVVDHPVNPELVTYEEVIDAMRGHILGTAEVLRANIP